MITHPVLIFCILIAIEVVVLSAAVHPRTRHFFRFLPSIFWMYFLPMCLSTIGVIASKNVLYDWSLKWVLPASLFLLLMGVDVKSILQLGKKALLMFFAGSFGIILGTIVSFWLFKDIVGRPFWMGFGALSASWTGGSANMVAVKEAIGTPDDIYLAMVVVDTVVPYFWMGLLMAASVWQKKIDRFNGADKASLDSIRKRLKGIAKGPHAPWRKKIIIKLLSLAFVISFAAQLIGSWLPVIDGVISHYAWVIILVSVFGLAFSMTRLSNYEAKGSTRLGNYLLYFVLTTIGVKASLSQIGTSIVLIAAGFTIVFIHACVLILAAKILKAPMMLTASASQANIGGVASAPIVAEVYQPGLSAIGLLMAILGNIIGTYLGIVTAQICRAIAG